MVNSVVWKFILTIILAISVAACGTLGGSEQSVSVTSEPPNANIIKGNRIVDKTPGRIKLDTNNPNEHTFYVEKEGYKRKEVRMSTSNSAPIIIGDIILGGVPLLLDAATDNLDRFNSDSKSVVLIEKDQKIAKKEERTEEKEADEEKSEPGIFGDKNTQRSSKKRDNNKQVDKKESEIEKEEGGNNEKANTPGIFSDQSSQSEPEKETANKKESESDVFNENNSVTNIKSSSVSKTIIRVKNTDFTNFEKTLKLLRAKDSIQVSKKSLKRGNSNFEVKSQMSDLALVKYLKNRMKPEIEVKSINKSKIVLFLREPK